MDTGTYGYISCTVRDYKGKSAVCKVRVPAAKATLKNAEELADYLKTHSDAQVVSFGVSKDAKGDSTDSGKYDRCYQRLYYLYEDQAGLSKRFSLPAPRDEDVNDDQEPTSDTAEDVKDLLVSVGAVKSATYNGGGLASRLPSSDARARAMTGI